MKKQLFIIFSALTACVQSVYASHPASSTAQPTIAEAAKYKIDQDSSSKEDLEDDNKRVITSFDIAPAVTDGYYTYKKIVFYYSPKLKKFTGVEFVIDTTMHMSFVRYCIKDLIMCIKRQYAKQLAKASVSQLFEATFGVKSVAFKDIPKIFLKLTSLNDFTDSVENTIPLKNNIYLTQEEVQNFLN